MTAGLSELFRFRLRHLSTLIKNSVGIQRIRAHLLLERLDTRSFSFLLVDSLHQNTLVLELVTLAPEVPVTYMAKKHTVGKH